MSRPTRAQVARAAEVMHLPGSDYPARAVPLASLLALFPEPSTGDAEAEADTVGRADTFLGYLDDAVRKGRYNCECQVGGVDAMSLDTDWLMHGVRLLKAGWTTLRQADAQQPRETVTTAEEFDALPVGSVVRNTYGGVFVKVRADHPDFQWAAAGFTGHFAVGAILGDPDDPDDRTPATVLHRPEETS